MLIKKGCAEVEAPPCVRDGLLERGLGERRVNGEGDEFFGSALAEGGSDQRDVEEKLLKVRERTGVCK